MESLPISAPADAPDLELTNSDAVPPIRQRGGNANWPDAAEVKRELIIARYVPEQISDILWLLDWVRTEKLKSYADLCDRIKWDADTTVFSRIMRGRYKGGSDAQFEKFFSKISGLRKTLTARQDLGEEPICETSVVTKIGKVCDVARVSATIALIHGQNQSGKTSSLGLYKERNNHGRTILVRMPVGATVTMFARALAAACGFSVRNNYYEVRERAFGFFDSTMLLIVDEFHQCFLSNQDGGSVRLRKSTIEFIREIHDTCRCGLVLCSTDIVPEAISDPRYAKFLGQLANRGALRLRIPAEPLWTDVIMICAAYGLPKPPRGDARKIVLDISNRAGIGKLTKYLRFARSMAAKRSQPLDWSHFLTTHATFSAWASGELTKDEQEAQKLALED